MKKLISLFSEKFNNIFSSFSFTEKAVFVLFATIFVVTSLLSLSQINQKFLTKIPKSGGTLIEGAVGTPRFINPLLAISDTDRDLTNLIYSGLTRTTPDGNAIPDLASSFEISEDGLEYLFKIRDDAVFHDGKEVTSDDVIFTIEKAKDSSVKSPKRANWEGVSVEKVSDKEVRFVLTQAYSPFLFNTTLGILPKHIWNGISTEEFAFTQINIEPIGSGPYEISKINRDSSGVVTGYELQAFGKFTLGKPYIKNIYFKFFRNEDALVTALKSGVVTSVNGIQPQNAKELSQKDFRVEEYPLPTIFGVFFNQSKAPILTSKSVREALNLAVNKQNIVDTVLEGYGVPINSPVPESVISFTQLEDVNGANENSELNLEEAKQILADAGFEKNENGVLQRETKAGIEILSFSVSTSNVPELVSAAEKVIETWKSLGADVTLKVFDPNDFTTNVIRPRNYDAILFGEIIGRDLDFYAFWHSSQRNDPGLNIADYANIDVDAALLSARQLDNGPERIEKLRIFIKEIKNDIPAVFLYSPNFIYVIPDNLQGVSIKNIETPSERFLSVYNWYLETDTVWRIFNKN